MAGIFLLDTNGVSDLIRDRSVLLRQEWFRAIERRDEVSISAITHAELLYGFVKNPGATSVRAAYEDLLIGTNILSWTKQASQSYAQLRSYLRSRNLVLDTMDLLIASQAYAMSATLVSRDKDFRHVEDMVQVVNWATDLAER